MGAPLCVRTFARFALGCEVKNARAAPVTRTSRQIATFVQSTALPDRTEAERNTILTTESANRTSTRLKTNRLSDAWQTGFKAFISQNAAALGSGGGILREIKSEPLRQAAQTHPTPTAINPNLSRKGFLGNALNKQSATAALWPALTTNLVPPRSECPS